MKTSRAKNNEKKEGVIWESNPEPRPDRFYFNPKSESYFLGLETIGNIGGNIPIRPITLG